MHNGVAQVVQKLLAGKGRQVRPLMWITAAAFLAFFLWGAG